MPRPKKKASEDPNGPEMLNVDQVAAILGVSRRQVERLLGTGCIPGSKKFRWARRVHEPTLRAWIAAGCPGTRGLPKTKKAKDSSIKKEEHDDGQDID